MEVDLIQEHAPGLDPGLRADTIDAVAQGPTARVPAHAPTAAAHRLDDTRLHLYYPISSRSPVTTATATLRTVGGIATAEEAPATRGSALARAPALPSKWTESVTETGSERGIESGPRSTSPPRNTSTSEEVATENGETGRGLAPMNGTGSAATRANTTAAAAVTQDIVDTGADSHT